MESIAVIGAGTMGNGIAHVFAQYGYKVTLVDVNGVQLEKAVQTITRNLDRQLSKGSINETQKSETLKNIVTEKDLAAGVKNTGLVVEAATENIDLKLKIFKQLDESAPVDAILASNTSSISITKIAATTKRPQ